MPRYFIDTDDGRFQHRDEVGFELPDPTTARKAALDALPDMARGSIPNGDDTRLVVTVRDETGETVYTATLSLDGRWGAASA